MVILNGPEAEEVMHLHVQNRREWMRDEAGDMLHHCGLWNEWVSMCVLHRLLHHQ